MKYNKKLKLITKLSSAGAILAGVILGSCGDKKPDAPTPAATIDQGTSQAALTKILESNDRRDEKNDRKDKKKELNEIAGRLTKKINELCDPSITNAIPIPDGARGTYTAENKKGIGAAFNATVKAKFDNFVSVLRKTWNGLLEDTIKKTEFKETNRDGRVTDQARAVQTTNGLTQLQAQGFSTSKHAKNNIGSMSDYIKKCEKLAESIVYIGKDGSPGRIFPKKVVCEAGFHEGSVNSDDSSYNCWVDLTKSLGLVLGFSGELDEDLPDDQMESIPLVFDLSNSPQCHENVKDGVLGGYRLKYVTFRKFLTDIHEIMALERPIDEQYIALLEKEYEKLFKPYIEGDYTVKGPVKTFYTDEYDQNSEYKNPGGTINRIQGSNWRENPKLKESNASLSGYRIMKDGVLGKALKRLYTLGKKDLDLVINMCKRYRECYTALHGNTTGEQPSEKPKAEKEDKKEEGSGAGKKENS